MLEDLPGVEADNRLPEALLPLTCTTECNSDRSSRQMRLVQRISPVALEGLSPISLRDAPSPRRGRLYGSPCPRRRHQTRYRPFAAWPYLLSPSAESTSDDEGCRPSHNKRQASNLMLAPRPTHRQPPTRRGCCWSCEAQRVSFARFGPTHRTHSFGRSLPHPSRGPWFAIGLCCLGRI